MRRAGAGHNRRAAPRLLVRPRRWAASRQQVEYRDHETAGLQVVMGGALVFANSATRWVSFGPSCTETPLAADFEFGEHRNAVPVRRQPRARQLALRPKSVSLSGPQPDRVCTA